MEDYIVHLLILANKVTLHAKRERVEPKDINISRKIFD